MTVREYLSAMLSRFLIGASDIELIMVNQDLSADAPADPVVLKKALYNEMSATLPVANVSEGQFSVSWNLDALRLWYSALCRELGVEDMLNPAPRVEDKSSLW